jgi:hypothetical protein
MGIERGHPPSADGKLGSAVAGGGLDAFGIIVNESAVESAGVGK